MRKTPPEGEAPDQARRTRQVGEAEPPPAEAEARPAKAEPAGEGGLPRAPPAEAAVPRGAAVRAGTPDLAPLTPVLHYLGRGGAD